MAQIDVPGGNANDRELYLSWLDFLRGAVLRKVAGMDDEAARWRPNGKLISPLGIINHLTHVEWRWIDGGINGAEVSRQDVEFQPGMPIAEAIAAYRQRAKATNVTVRATSLTAECALRPGADLRWVLLHLINETARHAGHADAVREMWDGATGE